MHDPNKKKLHFSHRPHIPDLDERALLTEQAMGVKVSSLPIPTGDFVLIEQVKEIKSSSILIPGMAQKESKRFVVRDKGPGRMTEYGFLMKPDQCQIGDEVYVNLNPNTAAPLDFNGRQLFLCAAMHIMAILRPEPDPVPASTSETPEAS